ncbi:hypothetical protein GQX73_g1098 [Xylaria multiplex]|uniref:Protein kinase domain-containing protein n=1 Tax=Xylaria multiplex TaxID=323545 RepID=A0A7C8J125_9PEZI|nr:hypothetical protein GQX73_g1098 [Xylaria multiplex]
MNSSDSDDSGSDISVSPELPPQKKLLDRIVESYCLSKSNGRDERFFPNNALSRLVTEDTIITELSSGKFRIDDIYTERRDRDEFVEWILKEAPKLFLICVRVKLSPKRIFESLTRFKERRFTDQELPIQDLEHILPFIEKDSQSKTGAFSSVFKVTIHEAHRHPTIGQVALKEIQTSHDSAPEHRQGITTGEVWEVEARALSMVNVLEHDHIVRCIATIRKGDKRYFMFPWASGGSLREFWEENHKPDLTKDLVREVLSELRGLADGLRRLHIYEPEQFSQAEDQSDSNLPEAYSENINNAEIPNIHVEEVGGQAVIGRDESGHQSIRHGDLKPENILRFLNSQTKDSNSLCSIGNLKIADLGLAKRHVVATEYRAQKTSTMYGTALYEAPEAAQSLEKKARSRLYDVWSMGCIMFEFVLWMLHGNELVTQLHDRLKKESNQYFELPTGMAGTARVHKTVTQWMQYLQENDPDCGENTAIGDLLRLIKTKLLVVNLPPGGHSGGNGQLVPTRPFQPPPPGEDKTNYRCTAEGLLNALDNISHKMNDDSRYTLSGESRHNIKPPSTIPEASDEANSSLRIPGTNSLCIIQGEDGDFSEESKRMEDVFSCAYCVLAASRATGQHDGFLQPINQREYITFPGTAGNPFYVCENIDDFSGDVLEGSLNTRGWVLQERALARRTIFFTERQTYFECGKGVRCQSLTNMHNNMSDFLGDPNFPKKAISVQRGLRIRYFQDLYKQYSRLNFTHIEDRPFAIEGLENRLRTAYETGGAYGIFDDGLGKGLFHRSLLWQRGEDEPAPGLLRIVFPSGRKVAVPTWSWMAYRGGIDYVDPPFDQTIWEKEDIHPPRIKSNTSSLHGHDRMELLAAVRWFNAPDDQDKELKLVYDTGENKLGDMRLPSPLDTPVDGGYHIYERVGAGVMPGRFISFDEPSQQVKIR